MNVASYARCGVDQGDYGIDAQLEQLRNWAHSHNLDVHREYIDIGPGLAISDRTGWNDLIADSMKGEFDTVVVTNADRISRSAQEIDDIVHNQEALNIMFIS